MAFDKSTRNRLASFVSKARNLLTDEFRQQFQSLYGISDKGVITPLEQLGHLDDVGLSTALLLRERIDYLVRSHPDDKDGTTGAVDRLAREQAFTVLNRLAAVRMAEKRDLVIESVGKGYQSKGFQVFEQVAGSGLGETYQRYCRYLFCLFDELAVDLGVLFDRRSPQGLLFPRESALQELLKLLNAPDLEALWVEDETIGWIYQYYNDPAERKKMRESAAPRNSRELAVRNQFFTPRYVVEFLTDNTLGRIWYEMTQGQTWLKDECRYLVRRPTEIFLNPGDTTPDNPPQDGLSQEELLKQPVYIAPRPLKDPRDIRMLDPACGSMHFGLYAFDLFEVIYDEAWELEEQLGADALSRPPGMKSLHDTHADKDTFLTDVPRLIIEHNLHGIDIDPRAVQIAGLSLWLRAQRTWQQQGLRPQNRPRIRRSNIVCAEPMPGDEAFLEEFIATHLSTTPEGKLLGQLVRRVFDAMRLAGEAGSLLKIEEEVAGAVAEAKEKWLDWIASPKMEQGRLFADNTPRSEQLEFRLDVTGITDETFWEETEERIYTALQAYAEHAEHGSGYQAHAEHAEHGSGYQRRLFADDAAHGFAFIDLCRKRYDVVLMNPPFGAASKASKGYVVKRYATSAHDVFAAFVERGLLVGCRGGRLGAITSRTGLFLETFVDWRKSSLFGENSTAAVLDLGYGVLDAMVETAAYIIERGCKANVSTCIRGIKFVRKDAEALNAIDRLIQGNPQSDVFIVNQADFERLPLSPFPYWLPQELLALYYEKPSFISKGGSAKKGISTGDNFRFVRTTWEIEPVQFALNREATFNNHRWTFFPKGGEYSPFYDDVHLVISWAQDGLELKSFTDRSGNPLAYPRSEQLYFQCGLTYPYRTTSGFNLRPLPAGCVFSDGGQAVFFSTENASEDQRDYLLAVLGYFSTRYARIFMEVALGEGDAVTSGSAARNYVTAAIESVPMFGSGVDIRGIALRVAECVALQMRNFSHNETSRTFHLLRLDGFRRLSDAASYVKRSSLERSTRMLELGTLVEREFRQDFGLSAAAEGFLDVECGKSPTDYPTSDVPISSIGDLCALEMGRLVDEALKVVGPGRYVVKKMYLSDRRIELISHILKRHPSTIFDIVASLRPDEIIDHVVGIISPLFGTAFNRWDIRYATGEKPVPELPDAFEPLPVCPPGQLQNEQGLPITREDVERLKEEGQWNYPIEIPWDGILVDDPGYPLDIEARIQQVLKIIWRDHWEAIEREACEILGVKSLRDYFRKPSGFFADHLKRYSKSRRQAPIYWPLSTSAGSYTLWIYYHRLTDNTLHTALADFIDPKLKSVRLEISSLRESGAHRDRLEELLDLEKELEDFRAEIERIIKLPWKPNLNDGVIITASPLWKLFRLPKWQKDLKACWEKLEKGDYDWAHLAYSIWPKRVEEVCKTDRSIAIAHDLEHLCTLETPKPKAKRRKKSSQAALEGMES